MTRASRLWRHPLLHFLALGTILFAGQHLLPAADDRPVVRLTQAQLDRVRIDARQQLGRDMTAGEFAAALAGLVDREILIAEARRRNWHRTDTLVRRRLRQNLAFSGQLGDGADPLAAAYAMGMAEQDVLVRKRLELLMTAALKAGATTPTGANVAGQLSRSAGRQRRWSFVQVLRSGPRAADELAALATLDRVRAVRHSEPLLVGNSFTDASDREIRDRFGPAFLAQLERQRIGAWAGPIRSPYGQHLVWIEARQELEVQAGPDQVWLALSEARESLALREGLQALRQRYRVEIVQVPA